MCLYRFSASSIELKHLCLEYITPWLPNLVKFCKHSDDTKRQKVAMILDKLITLTIEEVEMYPSIQAKIWGSLGQVTDLIDMVLDSFIKRSVTGGLGSPQAEIMADTAVALASANVQLVARKVGLLPAIRLQNPEKTLIFLLYLYGWTSGFAFSVLGVIYLRYWHTTFLSWFYTGCYSSSPHQTWRSMLRSLRDKL